MIPIRISPPQPEGRRLDQKTQSRSYPPPRCKVVHAGFDDPPKMAEEPTAKWKSAEHQLDCYRRVRDEIRAFVEKLPDLIKE